MNINRQHGVELRVTLEAFGHEHKATILNALCDAGYKGVLHLEYERDFECNILGIAESIGYYRGIVDTMR